MHIEDFRITYCGAWSPNVSVWGRRREPANCLLWLGIRCSFMRFLAAFGEECSVESPGVFNCSNCVLELETFLCSIWIILWITPLDSWKMGYELGKRVVYGWEFNLMAFSLCLTSNYTRRERILKLLIDVCVIPNVFIWGWRRGRSIVCRDWGFCICLCVYCLFHAAIRK